MTRRSQMEILIDILKVVADGNEKPTHIMYRANLSWTRLKEQLDFLMKQEMLVEIEGEEGTIYKLTLKGKEVLEYFRKIEAYLTNSKHAIPTEVYASYR
ncbi:MAG: winged helix-turn-helix domain-containing protein [Candidatus Bathyarchaeia archaeon]